jgi:hypothetical protein
MQNMNSNMLSKCFQAAVPVVRKSFKHDSGDSWPVPPRHRRCLRKGRPTLKAHPEGERGPQTTATGASVPPRISSSAFLTSASLSSRCSLVRTL